LESTGNVE
jgi:hypothetical protein